jgi:HD-like signal output (HDOD) protein
MKRLALCLLKDRNSLLEAKELPQEWEFKFASDRQSAFQALLISPYEAVVTDGPWKKGDEPDFFKDLAARCPQIVRVRLFDSPQKTAPISGDALADQCLPKPCRAVSLLCAIRRGKLLRQWRAEPAISRLLPRIRKVPSVPSLYFRLVQMLEAGDGQLEEVGSIMKEDFAMTAKLLQLVNSPFFGLKRTITNPSEAVTYLGLVQSKALVLLAQVFSKYSAEKTSRLSMDQLWRHSTVTAKLARAIIEAETGDASQADTAFTAGLLHDVGKLFHAANCPQEYNTLLAQAERNDLLYVDVEQFLMGTTHADLGACVLGTWGLPAETLEIIAFHHTPGRHLEKAFGPMTAVHVANAFDYELNKEPGSAKVSLVDHYYLKRIGCEKRLSVWKEQCAALARAVAA